MNNYSPAICDLHCETNQECHHPIHAHVLMDGLDPIAKHVCGLLTRFLLLNLYSIVKCSPSCGTNKECTSPNTCTCVDGWTESNCDIGILAHVV